MSTDVLAALPADVQQRILASVGTGVGAPSVAAPTLSAQPVQRSRDTDPTALQLGSEKFPLNDEQQVIVDAVVTQGLDTVIRALAGTGKTTTLEALARRLQISRPNDRILYIAFNRSVRQEADARMPSNVESRTGHSLAWNGVGIKIAGKMSRGQLMREHPDIATSKEVKFLRSRPHSVGRALGISPEDAETVKLVVDTYVNSADDDLSLNHLEAIGRVRELPSSKRGRLELFDAAQRYWEDVSTPLGSDMCKFAATNDHFRKIWALSKPDFTQPGSGVYNPAQIVFLDEAQDTPPVLAKVIDQQSQDVQLCVVGDANQAIYGFTGAISYLDDVAPVVQADLPLTTSYRFGDEIAGIANRFLKALGSDEFVTGDADFDEVGSVDEPDAVLTRTNSGMIEEIIRESNKGRRVGLLADTRADLISLIDTTAHLRDGGPEPATKHKLLGKYKSWNDVQREAEQAKGMTDLTVALGIVTKWTLSELSDIAEDSQEVVDAKRAGCDVVIVTAHRAKGLEWEAVRIADDFYGPTRKPPAVSETEYDDPEHLRLDYVAVTRAKRRLDLGSLRWILSHGKK